MVKALSAITMFPKINIQFNLQYSTEGISWKLYPDFSGSTKVYRSNSKIHFILFQELLKELYFKPYCPAVMEGIEKVPDGFFLFLETFSSLEMV